MIGRCGRDGRDGLAVLLVEPKRKFGLNTPEAIRKANKLSNDTRMDSLAITPVCLRIAFSVDNLSVLLTPTEFVVIEEVLTAIGF